jgi:hypothetical protein
VLVRVAEAGGIPRLEPFATKGTIMRTSCYHRCCCSYPNRVGREADFLWAPPAEANLLSVKSVSMDISEMERNAKNLPVQKIHDMTFVFPE